MEFDGFFSSLGFNIDTLIANQSVGIFIDAQRNLKVLINGQDKGIVVQNVPQVCVSFFFLVHLCLFVLSNQLFVYIFLLSAMLWSH